MRLLALLLSVLLAGCLIPSQEREWVAEADPCDGLRSLARGVHAGAWENATHPESGFRVLDATEGIPVGPVVAALLGTAANVTSVQWRVDGGPVDASGHESWSDGHFTSPEYLRLSFWTGPELSGRLDPTRSWEDATAVVASFLDAVRGEQPDNAELAHAAVPYVRVDGRAVRQGSTEDGAEVYAFPTNTAMPLPDGPWAVSSHLSVRADPGILHAFDSGQAAFVDGAWNWTMEVPQARTNVTYAPGAVWYAKVDALDRLTVFHGSNETLDEAAFLARLEDALPRFGVVGADLDGWRLKPNDWYEHLCEPEPGVLVTASP